MKIKNEIAPSKAAIDAHIIPGLFVSTGIDKQTRTVQLILQSGANQRRVSVL